MLKQIKALLDQEKYESSIIKGGKDLPFYDRLLVFIGIDSKKRERILEISSQEQILHPEQKSSPKGYFRIQFQYFFLFAVEDTAMNQVANLLLFLNQQIDFPGLELNEVENKISYRYVWLTKGNGIDHVLILSIVGIIRLLLDLFTDTLERVAEGKTTFNELLEEIVQMAQGTRNNKT